MKVKTQGNSSNDRLADLVTEPACEEGANSRSCPAEDIDDERCLNAVALGDEDQVVTRPQGTEDSGEISLSKVVLRSMLLDNDSLPSQGAADPLDAGSVCELLVPRQQSSSLILRCTLRFCPPHQ